MSEQPPERLSPVWFGVDFARPEPSRPSASLAVALERLHRAGIVVARVPEPFLELYDVQGRGELTRNQVLDLANKFVPRR